MGDVFPEVRVKQKAIQDIIRREEESFNKTLDRGIEVFGQYTSFVSEPSGHGQEAGTVGSQKLSGVAAFTLYDTYGFPLDLTELMARERGLTVDVAGFEKLMEEQRERARKAQKREAVTIADEKLKLEPTKFLGYDFLEAESVVETVLAGKKSD